MKLFTRILITVILTIVSQIGGALYLISIVLIPKKSNSHIFKRASVFVSLYLLFTFLIIPHIAPIFGRVKIEDSKTLESHSFFYKLLNRNYVKPELHDVLITIAEEGRKANKDFKLIYLDANFPFIDNFPLLPHLSHNDGKKIDVTLMYQNKAGVQTNLKPSRSGYGAFVEPNEVEFSQTHFCKENGYWQYDYPKYLTLGTPNDELVFSNDGTKRLLTSILEVEAVGKIFIEQHLKARMSLTNDKLRFQGCGAVRHDDHIHFQIK